MFPHISLSKAVIIPGGKKKYFHCKKKKGGGSVRSADYFELQSCDCATCCVCVQIQNLHSATSGHKHQRGTFK